MRFALALAALAAILLVPSAAVAAPVPVETGVLVVNFGNYDTTKGTYVMDAYLWFRWDPAGAPANFTPLRYEFMNGRATATDRIADTILATGERETTFRVQASLYSEPRFVDYPYDTQTLLLQFEDAVNPAASLRYVPLADESGLDENVRIAGWRIEKVVFSEATKLYRTGEEFSRVTFAVEIFREPFSSTIKAFLPPLAFVIVAGLSFLLHPSKVLNRVTLGTGMLVSAVAFHISQTVSLPPIGSLILFDKVMLAVYAFVVGSLLVATLIAIDQDYWTEKDHSRAINLWGAVGTILGPALVLLVVTL